MTTNDPASFEAFYKSFLFVVALWIAGDLVCARFLRIVPSLTGQIAVGIIFGPYVLDWVPETWITLGNLGLTLLICQAGIEMDFETLQAIGPRGGVMAVVGSILPISIAFLVAYFGLGLQVEAAIAAACSFGPTSAGIAMNVLEQCGVLRSKLGQLIVAIAIVDDILALVVLSQLKALTAETVTVQSILIPIISALLWLIVGGAVALYLMPTVLDKTQRIELGMIRLFARKQHHDELEEPKVNQLWHIIPLLLAILPATHYTQASYLMGAFLVGLCICRNPHAADDFNRQLEHAIQWLMRIFFGATIGFSVPVTLFNNLTVIGEGFFFSLALMGKVAVGPLLTPILKKEEGGRRYDNQHLRDCAVVGLSMAGEAEFAFLVAGFGLSEGLFTTETYASVVFAILLSTIVSPMLLRMTLALWPAKDDPQNNNESNLSTGDTYDGKRHVTQHASNLSSSDELEPEIFMPEH